ncbi:MAG: ethylbenzene dehydrogenase-related protein, partial [Acidimicrobiia bacterium]
MSLSKTRLLTLTVVAAVVALGLTGVVPVWSQTQRITALEVSVSVPVDDPWNSLWDRVEPATVVLSPQNMVAPFGGGSVPLLDVRALHDAGRLYLLLEWEDSSIEDGVGRVTDFSDAAALQFPVTDADTPFTMGGPGVPVNIWHWKAVWQADIVAGFSGVQDEYPHTYVDMYPGEGDSLYRPAEALGNALAQRTHSTPIENLVAEGFGSLTTAEIQDVDGWGEWRDGR